MIPRIKSWRFPGVIVTNVDPAGCWGNGREEVDACGVYAISGSSYMS